MRTIIPLNDGWLYLPSQADGCERPDFDESGFTAVRLPHTNRELPYNNFDERESQFISCYRRHFTVDVAPGGRLFLHFEGVMAFATVYLNGAFVCEHAGGYTPFCCELSGRVQVGDNVLCVVADATERPDIPPFGSVIDYLTYGGIYREVWLEETGSCYVRSFRASGVPALQGWRLTLEGMIDGAGNAETYTLRCALSGAQGMVARHECALVYKDGNEQRFSCAFDAGNVLPWSLDDPVLYTLTLTLVQGSRTVDETNTRVGFRTARFEADGFYLNGKKLKLRGLNRHQSYPYVGCAMPKSAQRRDAELLKRELGVNMVRTSHYPQSKHFLDRCDELGLLVFEEIPGWQHIGGEEWKAVALKNVEEMITRDWNHPSIVIWGVRINESPDDDPFYTATNALAHRLDPSRQTGGVRNFEHSRLLEDVYTYNDFVHRGDNEGVYPPRRATKRHTPFLITEHNGHMFPARRLDGEELCTEHALRHLRVLDAACGTRGIAGAIGWCMTDYNTHKEFGSGDRICYHGVLDMFRLPKTAAAAYASQQDGRAVMEVASSMNRGAREGSRLERLYIFTNCDFVRMYRNGECVGDHYPDRARFGHLPHPPVVITDFVGDLLERHEGMRPRDAARVKRVFEAVVRYGDKSLPFRYRLLMGYAMLKRRMSYEDAVRLFGRYVAGWGGEAVEYAFEGYIGGKRVITVRKGAASSERLLVVPDAPSLCEAETYDVCRVVLRHLDTLGNEMTLSHEIVRLGIAGAGEIIGPKTLSLMGGSAAFWVKSAGEGEIAITISSDRFGEQRLVLPVTTERAGGAAQKTPEGTT